MRAGASILGMLALLAGCGGDDAQTAEGLPLPPAGASRWSAIERDDDGDGLAESITRYAYDALGRRVSQLTWRAERGVATGQPIEQHAWSYDSASRVLTQVVEDSRSRRTVSASYGADGLLASTRLQWQGSASVATTTYEWQRLRLVRAATDGASGPVTQRFFYGADGRIERVESRFGGRDEVDTDSYQWRLDGQLSSASFSLAVGNLIIHRLTHDALGRPVRSETTDDGFEDEARRFFHDARGRLERIEVDSQPSGFGDADFASDATYRIRWEDGLCQPTYLPALPPTFDRQITLQGRSDGASLGCAG